MGHRSWFTYVESKKELIDLWTALYQAQNKAEKLTSLGLDELVRLRAIPSYFVMDYVLSVTKPNGPFKPGTVVLAWSSSGDYTISVLPYYLRQQTEYIESVLSKFPKFHVPPDGPAAFGHIIHPVPGLDELISTELAPKFLNELPDVVRVEWGIKTEESFVQNMYNQLYRDPSALSSINQSVFISYSSKDRAFASRLARDLESFGLNVWIDQGEMKAGDSLIWKISEAVTKCDFFIVALSKNSIVSSWVKQELEIAMSQQLAQNRFKVIPVLKDSCELPPFLSGKLFVDFTKKGGRKEKIEKIIKSIQPTRIVPELFKKALGEENVKVNVKI